MKLETITLPLLSNIIYYLSNNSIIFILYYLRNKMY